MCGIENNTKKTPVNFCKLAESLMTQLVDANLKLETSERKLQAAKNLIASRDARIVRLEKELEKSSKKNVVMVSKVPPLQENCKDHKRVIGEMQSKLAAQKVEMKEKRGEVEKVRLEKKEALKKKNEVIAKLEQKLKDRKTINAQPVEPKSKAPASNVEMEAVKAKLQNTEKAFEEFKCFMEMRTQTNDTMIVQVWNNHQQLITDSRVQVRKLEEEMKDLKTGHRMEQMVWVSEEKKYREELKDLQQQIVILGGMTFDFD